MDYFTIDMTMPTTPFPHYWEKCVGSCHATTGLREDWRKHLKKCRDELGFQYVRFHGLFNDDMSVLCGSRDNQTVYSFFNIDSIFDFLLEIGMKPFVELSFMPHRIASGNSEIFHYRGNITPPKDYEDWGGLIEKLVTHLVSRYGIDEVRSWYFEVWNEPNLECFWSGTQEEYFKLYRYAAEAIKKVDLHIPAGGPATAKNGWVPEFIGFCRQNSVPLDFVSTHNYPTDEAIAGLNVVIRMANSRRGILTEKAIIAKKEAGDYPLFYTEWSSSPSCRDGYHDDPFAAAFILKTIADNQGLVDIYSYWTFSDIFEEYGLSSIPFHGGSGLLNIFGIPKPSYRAFEILHKMGDRRIPVEIGTASNIEILPVIGMNNLIIAVYNHNMPLNPIKEESVTIFLKGAGSVSSAYVERIDAQNANPKKQWHDMGDPEYPDKKTIDELYKNSIMLKSPIDLLYEEEGISFKLVIPPHGVAAVTVNF